MSLPARISIVTLGVADIGRSIAFYEALGWEKATSSQDGEIAWFHTADTNLGLFGAGALAADAVLPPPAPLAGATPIAFRGVSLAINVDTPEAVAEGLAAAVAAGATLLKPSTQTDWGGTSGYFADPDGHAWEIAHNPFFPIDEAGRVRIP